MDCCRQIMLSFMRIYILSSFLISWGVLMGTKWQDCCDGNATLGNTHSISFWANLDIKAAPISCCFNPAGFITRSSADHTLLKSCLGKHSLLQSPAVQETLLSCSCCDSSQLLSFPFPTPAWIQRKCLYHHRCCSHGERTLKTARGFCQVQGFPSLVMAFTYLHWL